MSKKQYNIFSISLILLFFAVSPILVGIVAKIYSLSCFFELDSYASYSINVINVFLAISIILFGTYCYFTEFRRTKEVVKPYILIILGVVFLVYSTGPSAMEYFVINKMEKDMSILADKSIDELKAGAFSHECENINNIIAASLYYRKTGKLIDYLDKNGEMAEFKPSADDKMEREKEIALDQELLNDVYVITRHFHNKIITVLLCILVWFVVLLYLPPKMMKIK